MLQSCEIIYRENFILENGAHPLDSILILLEGSFYCQTDGKEFIVGQNEIFFFKKNAFFKRQIISPIKALYIIFDKLPFAYSNKLNTPFLLRFNEDIRLLSENVSIGNKNAVLHLINDILFCCSYQQSRVQNQLICAIMDYFDKNYQYNISLDALVEKFNVSKQWLISEFKKYANKTPISYLNELRLNKSKELLLSSDMSISEIALKCGFENVYYFSTAFKKYTGFSPSLFRSNIIL